MTICSAFVLSLVLPFSYLLVKLCVYGFNKYNIFKCTNISFQYILCMVSACITTINFNLKNVNSDTYHQDIMSNVKIEGWFIDYFGLEFLTVILYFRLIDLRTENNIYFKTSVTELFSIDNILMNYLMNIIYVFIMMYRMPALLILETLYYLYTIRISSKVKNNYSNDQEEKVHKYIYTDNIKYFYICIYLFVLIIEFVAWIQLIIKWNNHLCLSGFIDVSTDTSYYITLSMIYIYFFQISLFSEIVNNRYLMVFLIILSFSNATLATCIYLIYFEFKETKIN